MIGQTWQGIMRVWWPSREHCLWLRDAKSQYKPEFSRKVVILDKIRAGNQFWSCSLITIVPGAFHFLPDVVYIVQISYCYTFFTTECPVKGPTSRAEQPSFPTHRTPQLVKGTGSASSHLQQSQRQHGTQYCCCKGKSWLSKDQFLLEII